MSYRLLAVTVVAVVGLFQAFETTAQTNDLTLNDAMRIAVAKSPSLDIARARLAQAAARSTQAGSAYWPNLSVPASISRQTYSDSSTIGMLSGQDSVEYYRLGLNASWTLFDGFARRHRRLSAEQAEEQTRAALDDATRLLLGGVASAFHTAQLARENLRISRADETFNQGLLDEAQSRLEAGAGSRSDVLNFEVQRNAATSDVLRQQESLTRARASLADAMGLAQASLADTVQLAGLAVDPHVGAVSNLLSEAVALAELRRPDLNAAQFGLRRSTSDEQSIRGDRWPSLALSGSIDGERQDDVGFESGDFGNTLGLTLNYTFSDGGLRRGRITEAGAVVSESEAVLRALVISVAAEVRQALASVDGASARLALQIRNAVTVRENRDLTEKAYRAGHQSLVRLNEAQRDLISAEGRLALARVALTQAQVRLDVVTGEILDRISAGAASPEKGMGAPEE